MSEATAGTQESRTERIGVAVTPTEKVAVRVIAGLRGTDESNLVRSTPIADIVAEFEQHRAMSEKRSA
jgi:hypothetical protein